VKRISFTPAPDVAVLFCTLVGEVGISLSGMPEGDIEVTFVEAYGADETVGSDEMVGEAVALRSLLGSEVCCITVSVLGEAEVPDGSDVPPSVVGALVGKALTGAAVDGSVVSPNGLSVGEEVVMVEEGVPVELSIVGSNVATGGEVESAMGAPLGLGPSVGIPVIWFKPIGTPQAVSSSFEAVTDVSSTKAGSSPSLATVTVPLISARKPLSRVPPPVQVVQLGASPPDGRPAARAALISCCLPVLSSN